jgi:hypothetical protein
MLECDMVKRLRFDAFKKICQILDYRPPESLKFMPNAPKAPGAMDHQKACDRAASGLFGDMNMIFDISDRARLPWRFFGVAKSSLRPRLLSSKAQCEDTTN